MLICQLRESDWVSCPDRQKLTPIGMFFFTFVLELFFFTADSELRGWKHNPVIPLFCMRTVVVCPRLKYA